MMLLLPNPEGASFPRTDGVLFLKRLCEPSEELKGFASTGKATKV
jgi:hypothetical protein